MLYYFINEVKVALSCCERSNVLTLSWSHGISHRRIFLDRSYVCYFFLA